MANGLLVGRTSWYIERISGTLILVVSIGLLLFYDAYVWFSSQWTAVRLQAE